MNPQADPNFDNHEELAFVADEATGLGAIIAIHSLALGPAAGGCRFAKYASEDAALSDVLRLSRGMSYKNAMADLPLGGGKAVIYRAGPDRVALFEKMGEAIEKLGGRYITAEDVGVSEADMSIIARKTKYVAGLPKQGATAGGDPSPWTALGVFLSIRRLVGDLKGTRVAVQGVGAVGFGLCELLAKEGARLVAADVNADRIARAKTLGAEIAPVERIHTIAADVFAPCALGAGLNSDTIPDLGAQIICGAANNQLATEADGARLRERGVLYAPDYIVNAGGIINVSAEYLGESADKVEARVRAIPQRLALVLEQAKREDVPPGVAADKMARQRIALGPSRAQ